MNRISIFFLKNRAFSWLLLILIIAGGAISYSQMGKLEDAPFTIKQAVVTTSYPGASPLEVQRQVTDVLEEAIQSLGELYYIKTDNRAGLSKITVYVKKEIRAKDMQQLWDKLRRKVSDAQAKLPAGAGTSVVNDDFGDVLGVFYSLSGNGHSYRELEDQAKYIKNELLSVKDVAKVELYGIQGRTIEVSVKPSFLSQSGITISDIAATFDRQNAIVDAGGIETESNRLRVEASGSFSRLEEIENLTVTSANGEFFRLGDVASISESYTKPARNIMKVNNVPSVGIAISTVSDGNVVEMSKAVKECIDNISRSMPSGFSIETIYDQGHESSVANDGFVMNLIISVITVIAVLLFFIGFKNGMLIGSGLIFSIFGTLIYMNATGIALQRMSLAAIIIAMGMLVDNAIVVYDGALVNMQRGMRKRKAITSAVSSTSMPLLGATLIAILTFLPVYLSPHITGEILSSLFIVIAVSLMLSWILAITQNVFFIQEFVRRPRPEDLKGELFQGRAYDLFRKALKAGIRHKYEVLKQAMDNYKGNASPRDIIRYFGGYEMVMAVGAMLQAAAAALRANTMYLIDENGIIEKVFPKVKPDAHAAEILAWLDEHLYLRDEIPGQGLAEVFGCHEADFIGMTLRQPDFRVGAMLGFRHLQYLEPTPGTALAGTSPRATIVHNRFGRGETLLIGSQVTLGIQRRNEIDPATVAEVASFALNCGVEPMLRATPAGTVECSRLTGPETDIFILGNRRPEPISIEIEFTETYRQFETKGDTYPGGTKLQLSLKGRETRMVAGRKYRRLK